MSNRPVARGNYQNLTINTFESPMRPSPPAGRPPAYAGRVQVPNAANQFGGAPQINRPARVMNMAGQPSPGEAEAAVVFTRQPLGKKDEPTGLRHMKPVQVSRKDIEAFEKANAAEGSPKKEQSSSKRTLKRKLSDLVFGKKDDAAALQSRLENMAKKRRKANEKANEIYNKWGY